MYPHCAERARLLLAFRLVCFVWVAAWALVLSAGMCAMAAGIASSTYWADQPGVLLRIGADARQLGMGGVVGEVGTDGFSAAVMHQHPAGLAAVQDASVTLTRLHLPADIELEGLFYAQTLGRVTEPTAKSADGHGRWGLGVGLLRLSSGAVPETSGDGTQIGSFSYTSGLFLLGLAYEPPESPFSIGATGKALLEQFDLTDGAAQGSGVGLDLGLIYRIDPSLQLSAGLQNVSGLTVRWATGEVEQADPLYRVGLAWRGPEHSPMAALRIAGEWLVSAEEWHAGLEYHIAETLALRLGLDRGEPTVGIGANMGEVRLDYAFLTRVPLGGEPMDSGYVMGIHAVSVGVAF